MRSVAAFALVVSLLAAAPAAAASRTDPPGRMKAVVRAWSARLNAGDNRGIAALFRLPAVVIQGQYAYRLTTPRQVEIWHAALPCSGRIVSITVHGRFATAVFRLGDRPTSKCDAPGSLAAARFGIVRGKIVSWEQVPVDSAAGPVAYLGAQAADVVDSRSLDLSPLDRGPFVLVACRGQLGEEVRPVREFFAVETLIEQPP